MFISYEVPCKTLSNRLNSQMASQQQTTFEYHQHLDAAQEVALIDLMSRLTSSSLSSTDNVVKNLTEQMIRHCVGKNLSYQLVNRYKHRLVNYYFGNVDQKPQNNILFMSKQLYALVMQFRLFLYCYWLLNRHFPLSLKQALRTTMLLSRTSKTIIERAFSFSNYRC